MRKLAAIQRAANAIPIEEKLALLAHQAIQLRTESDRLTARRKSTRDQIQKQIPQ